jgi:cobalt/nickel transport protein
VSVRKRDALIMVLGTLAMCTVWAWLVSGHASTGEWAGVDEAVIGRFVDATGRRSPPLFDWVRGDLLLFAFLVAGLLAGFVLGFFARSALGREPGVP